MSGDKSLEEKLSDAMTSLEKTPNIWGTAPVEAEPEKWIDAWRVFKVVKASGFEDHFGLHFVGRNRIEDNGAVSSKIETFDPRTMRGRTRSGRVYQLVGLPGLSDEAQYVFANWCRFNQVEAEDATQEFIRRFDISLARVDMLRDS